MKNYSEEDFKKLELVLSGFEKIESKLGDSVSVDLRDKYSTSRYNTSMLYSVRRFIGIEVKFVCDDRICLMPFSSVDKGIEKIEDVESNAIYSNQNFDFNPVYNDQDRDFENYLIKHLHEEEFAKGMYSFPIDPRLPQYNRDMSFEIEIMKLRWGTENSLRKRRRQLFGNIVADIEDRFLKSNGQELYTYGSKDDKSYISMLEIYEEGLPKGYSLFSEIDNQSKK